jgi:hypothetical protein
MQSERLAGIAIQSPAAEARERAMAAHAAWLADGDNTAKMHAYGSALKEWAGLVGKERALAHAERLLRSSSAAELRAEIEQELQQ